MALNSLKAVAAIFELITDSNSEILLLKLFKIFHAFGVQINEGFFDLIHGGP